MFKVGEYIVCGHNGVCKVERIGVLEHSGDGRLFYTLSPWENKTAHIFTPVDNMKMIMRPVMTKQEALDLVDSMGSLCSLTFSESDKKENAYKAVLKRCDPEELARLIKTIYERKRVRRLSGKKEMVTDAKYYKLAKKQLYGEIAAALSMETEQVQSLIKERIDML